MFKNKKALMAILAVVVVALTMSLVLSACDSTQSADTGVAITVDNDSVEAGEQGVVTDPTAGAKTGPEQSGGVEFDSMGTTALEDGYVAQGDILDLALGITPAIPHGTANGTNCVSCHETGVSEAPVLLLSHQDAGLTDEYCRNCHKDVELP